MEATKYESVQKRWFTVNFKNFVQGRSSIESIVKETEKRYGAEAAKDIERILRQPLHDNEFYCGPCMSIKTTAGLTEYGIAKIIDRTGTCADCIEAAKQRYNEKSKLTKGKITTPLKPEDAQGVGEEEIEIEHNDRLSEYEALKRLGWKVSAAYVVPLQQDIQENQQLEEQVIREQTSDNYPSLEELMMNDETSAEEELKPFGWKEDAILEPEETTKSERIEEEEVLLEHPEEFDTEKEAAARSEEKTDHMPVQGPGGETIVETTAPRRTANQLSMDAHAAMLNWMQRRDTESALELFKHMIEPKPVTLYYIEVILTRSAENDVKENVRRNWFEFSTPFHKILFSMSDIEPTEDEEAILKEYSLNYFLYTM